MKIWTKKNRIIAEVAGVTQEMAERLLNMDAEYYGGEEALYWGNKKSVFRVEVRLYSRKGTPAAQKQALRERIEDALAIAETEGRVPEGNMTALA
jgi:hypothetical protein